MMTASYSMSVGACSTLVMVVGVVAVAAVRVVREEICVRDGREDGGVCAAGREELWRETQFL